MSPYILRACNSVNIPLRFIVLRYSVLSASVTGLFFSAIPTSHCVAASAVTWASAILVTITGGMIFCVRVLSLWDCNRWIVLIVGTMYTAMVGCWISVAIQVRVANGPPTQLFSNCKQVGIPSTSSLSYASSVAFDLVIVTLTLTRIPRPLPFKSSGAIANTLYGDSLLYFITATIVNITVLTIESLKSDSLSNQLLKPLFIPLSTACTAILASRVFLNLRNAANGRSGAEDHSFGLRSVDMNPHTRTTMSRIIFHGGGTGLAGCPPGTGYGLNSEASRTQVGPSSEYIQRKQGIAV